MGDVCNDEQRQFTVELPQLHTLPEDLLLRIMRMLLGVELEASGRLACCCRALITCAHEARRIKALRWLLQLQVAAGVESAHSPRCRLLQ